MRTGQEIRDIFNLHYDNIMSAASPGLNDYEISLYLTQAHKEIIYNYYSGKVVSKKILRYANRRTLYDKK